MTTIMEEWRDVPGFPGYKASSEGRIIGRRGWVLRPAHGPYGHLFLSAYVDGKLVRTTAHHLVCAAFHGPRPEGKHVAHGDGNPGNNRPENLRWATPKENHADAVRHGTHSGLNIKGERMWNAKLTAEAVRDILTRPYKYGVYSAMAREYGVTPAAIKSVIYGTSWRHVSGLSAR